ncbi:MAG: tRNA lysidine(34) synthetase TilS, partial [Thermomicrobiales bacterium]
MAGGSIPPVGTSLVKPPMTPPSAHLAPAEQRLSQRVLGRLRGLRLTDGGTVAVGFSGGPDSLCLALVLAKLAPVAGIRAVLVHVDHGLRPSSAEQARQAAVLAEAVALPFRVVRLEPGLRERHPGVGIEEAARRERLLALATEAERVGAEVVALAHHLEDQAETTLLHLLRGAGLAGARGMASTTTMLLPWWNAPELTPMTLRLWRPLLQEPKAALDGCLRASGLAAVRDESNDDAAFRRNWLRAEIIPALRRG